MGQKNQGIFSIEKYFVSSEEYFELTMTLMRLITIKYFNRLTALVLLHTPECFTFFMNEDTRMQ